MALPIPRGTAIAMAPAVTSSVSTIKGKIPNEGSLPVGFQDMPKTKSRIPSWINIGYPS